MAATVSLYLEVRSESGHRKNILVNLGRGRRPADLSGPFYLRYFCPSRNKRVWEHAGHSIEEATTARSRRENVLRTKASGVEVAEEQKQVRLRIDAAIEDYYVTLEATGKDHKTIDTYKRAITDFRQSCRKTHIDEVGKPDLIAFMAWLRKQPRKPRKSGDPNRTYYNKVSRVAIFLKAYGKEKLLKKMRLPEVQPQARRLCLLWTVLAFVTSLD